MARGRMLNNKISASRQMNDLLPNDTCRLLATWILAHLDKNGVFYGEPVMVKSFVFPRRADVSVEEVEAYLHAMENAGLIVRFIVDNEWWQWWPSFASNQVGLRPERESTTFPPPPAAMPDAQPSDAGNLPETCRNNDGELPAEEKLSEYKLIPPTAEQSEDDWLSESRITPCDDPALPIATIPTDPLDHAVQAAHSPAVNWAAPPDAGGHDDYADAPLAAFCRLVGFSPDSLPAKKRNGWAKALRGVGEEWGVGPPVVAACIERIPDSEYHWKTYSAPYQDSFQTDLGTLIGQHLTEQQHGPPQKIVELKLR